MGSQPTAGAALSLVPIIMGRENVSSCFPNISEYQNGSLKLAVNQFAFKKVFHVKGHQEAILITCTLSIYHLSIVCKCISISRKFKLTYCLYMVSAMKFFFIW